MFLTVDQVITQISKANCHEIMFHSLGCQTAVIFLWNPKTPNPVKLFRGVSLSSIIFMFWVAVVPIEVYRCLIRTLHIHCCVRHFGTVNLMSFTIIIIEYSKIYKLITCCCRRTQSTRSIFGDSSTNGGWLMFRGPWKQPLMRNLHMYNRSLYLYTVLSSYLFNEGWQPTLRYHTATYCVGVSIRLFTILSHIINMISILHFYIVIVSTGLLR